MGHKEAFGFLQVEVERINERTAFSSESVNVP